MPNKELRDKHYIPKDKRKKILLLCDDIRVHSGIAHMGRELVMNTAHHYNWVNLGGAVKHPEAGQRFDLSQDTDKQAGIQDSSVTLYPTDGYGNPDLIRQLIQIEKPDALFLITDPRYWVWLFQMENEIRKHCPIVYLNIWDDYPAPLYNETFYESCDALLGISKQTVNINKLVLGPKAEYKIIEYVPHGVNHKVFRPLSEEEKSTKEFLEFKNNTFKGKEFEFVLFFNSRNIRRKQIPDTILAFRHFVDRLPKEQAKKCLLLLHTQPVDEHGTDLNAVIDLLCPENYCNVYFTGGMYDPERMNWLYNLADAQILLTSNEGWGLSLTEALVVGLPIIANVTGGMQDQMRFTKDGKWMDFDEEFPSNHRGTIKEHGPWAFPVYPTSRSLVGSVPTPYIFDDRCEPEDAADRIEEVYNLGKEGRKQAGDAGREWALGDEAGFTSEKMGNRVIQYVDELFDTWEPREKYEFILAGDYKKKVLNHKLIY
jgi:glycosyltransferase involved in cell wall biosynthesis